MKKMILTMLFAGSFGLLANSASAQTAQFDVTRDVGILGHGAEQASNAGGAGSIRPYKSNQNTLILDFDTVAMSNFLAANPGTATWTLNVNVHSTHTGSDDISIQTVESTNDWAEGDAAFNGGNLNWTPGTKAATYLYAQTAYSGTLIDKPSSLKWMDPDSGVYTFTKRGFNGNAYGAAGSIDGNPTPEFTNSASLLAGDLVGDAVASVVIDSNIIDAMINDVNNRGLRTGTYGVQSGGSNFKIFTREQNGKGAFLEVTVTPVPEPSSILLLMAGIALLPRRRRR